MDIQRLRIDQATILSNPGKQSVQIVWSQNAPDAQVTITRVTMEPGAISARHHHPHSEQIWIVEQGSALLLLAEGHTEAIAAGDVLRTPATITHGIENTGTGPFVYLAVTCPAEDMTNFYETRCDR
jgi:quercetin dioxygenase-like cupin family protein